MTCSEAIQPRAGVLQWRYLVSWYFYGYKVRLKQIYFHNAASHYFMYTVFPLCMKLETYLYHDNYRRLYINSLTYVWAWLQVVMCVFVYVTVDHVYLPQLATHGAIPSPGLLPGMCVRTCVCVYVCTCVYVCVCAYVLLLLILYPIHSSHSSSALSQSDGSWLSNIRPTVTHPENR